MARRYRFIKGVITGFIFGVSGTAFYHWDLGATPNPNVKYRLGEQPNLGIIVHQPMQPGPPLREFQCVGSEKDCGTHSSVRAVPLPGTFWLLGIGLFLIWRFRHR
jgi:hypothetical protein